jgi:hypothetical protein
MDGRTENMKVKLELRRWHEDKFKATILPRIAACDRQVVQHNAEEVTKILTLLKEHLT